MKKKLILVGILVGIVALIYIGYSGFRKQAWPVYKNSRYGFNIEYPPGWTLGQQETNNAGREMISEDTKIVCYAYGFENALDQTLEEFVDWLTSADTILEKTSTKLGNLPAIETIANTPENITRRGVYTMLDDNTGRGFFCTYEDQAAQKAHAQSFERMKNSFTLSAESISFENMHTACATLLAGATIPLKDYQTFIDDTYPAVTITSRDAWDQTKLPKQVTNLENASYTCYPMPYEMTPQENVPGMHVQPEVTSVEWICELEYEDYAYVDNDDVDKVATLKSQGYLCEETYCTDSKDNDSSVWLCSK